MLNILLGVGVSSTYMIRQTGEPYPLALSTTLLVSSIGLLALLIATLVVVPLNGYWINRPWAFVLIASYVIVMVVNVVVEVRNENS
jgi:sodium/potassium/calcium exchanger 6